ncbi:hypothetical protein BP5796_04923 [Coleophoma crateriformis]|uniref:Zn(2)-C6 fungal-type domain-containing protein n=1 Tax=Coleophoma crateriformis TaxID=565419 RepID=A0A3D8SAN4_9HELO|nr:hypothetical protein BP5796_04923 [Coleophoma crateriformis]
MSTAVKRACDACHRRKVKCDGINPCRNCSSAQLACTYHAIPQKKGPKGSRAKVISELRETQRQTTLSSKVANRLNGVSSPPCSPTLSPTPGLLTTEIIKESIEFFFANMYATMPILHRGRLEQQALYADQNVDTYCLMTSLCAFMMIQPGMAIPGDPLGLDALPGANLVSGTMLMEETLRVRKSYDHLESPTLNSLVTSFFLFGCYFGLDLHNKAWFHLREATTLAHILGMNKEETYHQYDVVDASRRRRLYWLLFVTERAYALQRHRPLSLQATITLPQQADDPTDTQSHHLHGFIHLVTLFRPFDDGFVALWNKTRSDCSPSYLAALQKQLSDALPSYLNATENQTADLRTSQQWLRTMVWQLSIQNGCLSSSHDDPSMTFQYPVEIARDLVSMTSQFSQQSMEVHGLGLIEKLFDVACSLTDVLSLLPPNPDPFSLGPRDYLHQFMTLLSVLRRGDHRFLPLLLSKVHDVLPRLVNPMLQTVPEKPIAEIDIFDGFGNGGMGVATGMHNNNYNEVNNEYKNLANNGNMTSEYKMPLPSHGLSNMYENKRIEDLSTPTGDSHGEPSPFTPPMMTSAMEYPGMSEFSFPDLANTAMSNGSPGQSNYGGDFKSEGNHHLGMRPRPPMRQDSGSSFSTLSNGMPRSIPDFVNANPGGMQRAGSHTDGDMSMGGEMPYR